ncbi:MAG TPA: methyltransferase domain-containing protein [Acidiferrobacter sp.]|nr:methyltransferase domain-containing protein [Acidiferrobacter sp.]
MRTAIQSSGPMGAQEALDEWPASGLESCPVCPVCGGSARHKRFEGLKDRVFFVAPGTWTLWQCEDCSAGYLDPRPNEATIGEAYKDYFTHGQALDLIGPTAPRSGWRKKIGQPLRNGYLNHRFGYSLTSASPLGMFLLPLLPGQVTAAESIVRHLPAPDRKEASLLDVGCGNGGFLIIAQHLGYQAIGLEPDPKATLAARAAGFEVAPNLLPGSGFAPGTFDQITLSHVVEHLHRPREAFAEMYSLLRPGGRVWISTPNLNSQGLERFGVDWRGLEPPRHLVLL